MSDRWISVLGTLAYLALASVGGALAPRLARVLRWPGRARGKALVAWWLWRAMWVYVMQFVVVRHLRAGGELAAQAEADLRAELGRDPTSEELSARFAARWAEAQGIDPPRVRH